MREIIASLRKGLVPDLTRLMLHIRQEGAS